MQADLHLEGLLHQLCVYVCVKWIECVVRSVDHAGGGGGQRRHVVRILHRPNQSNNSRSTHTTQAPAPLYSASSSSRRKVTALRAMLAESTFPRLTFLKPFFGGVWGGGWGKRGWVGGMQRCREILNLLVKQPNPNTQPNQKCTVALAHFHVIVRDVDARGDCLGGREKEGTEDETIIGVIVHYSIWPPCVPRPDKKAQTHLLPLEAKTKTSKLVKSGRRNRSFSNSLGLYFYVVTSVVLALVCRGGC